MRKNLSTIILILVFFIGLSVLLYPGISNYINSKTQSRAVAEYNANVSKMQETDYTQLFTQAEDYNARLFATANSFYKPSLVDGYDSCLNVNGVGVMGYVTIEKIKVELPIFHGTYSEKLNIACGHLEGTSLPTGGKNTHCVISAHRGLPSAKLFTDLVELDLGDVFELHILNRRLTYEVDQIRTVAPHEVDELFVKRGKDYCTLFTCTPYGINTHRLLVRGHRIESPQEKVVRFVPADAMQIEPILVAPVVAAPILLVLFVLLFVRKRDSA